MTPRRPDVLIPGAHRLDNGDLVEVGNHDFVGACLRELGDEGCRALVTAGATATRLLLDEKLRLVRYVGGRARFVPANRTHAALVRAAAKAA